MAWRSNRNKSPEEILKQKIRKKIRNQSRFLKHSIVYLVFLFFFLILAFFIREEEFVIPFLILFSFWMVGLIFHGLSAFVFNRINSWEETRYQNKLKELDLQSQDSGDDFDLPDMEDADDPMDLKSYERLRREMDKRWGEGDFV